MMDNNVNNTKYEVDVTTTFKRNYKKIKKQNRNIDKLKEVVVKLANKEKLDSKYKDHQLIDDKTYKNCRECHIVPDWLLIYKYEDENLILVLFATGSHSEVLNK